MLGYGYFRLSGQHTEPGARVALIQGCIPAELKADRDMAGEIHEQYEGLSAQAAEDYSDLDLIVWPETMFRYPLVEVGENPLVPEEFRGREDEYIAAVKMKGGRNRQKMAGLARTWHTALPLL